MGDKFFQFVLGTIRFLFIGNPHRTALGVIVGLALHTLVSVFNPAIKQIFSSYIDVAALTEWNCMLMGLVFVYSPTIISFIGSPKKELLNESVEKVFRMIRLAADEAGISKRQKRDLYHKLCERAVEQVTFNAATQKELRKLTALEEEEEQTE